MDVPPYNSKEEISVHPVQIQAEEGDEWLEMTRQEYADFWVKIKFFCAEEEIMSKENFCPKCARGKLSRQGSLTLGAHEVCDFCRSLFDLCPACGQRLIEREPFPGASFIDSYVCVCEAQLIVPVDPTKKIHEAKAPIALSAKLCA
ncbi:hypothetical protein KKF25_01220 [Patescibacteria group bacterium]|nr:hypothetical protein [Patescibacteria group bacterium]